MTDLITRLRALSRPGGGGSIGHEAADEIERLQAGYVRRAATIEAQAGKINRLRAALRNLLDDTQHVAHADCDDGPCPVREARAALTETQ